MDLRSLLTTSLVVPLALAATGCASVFRAPPAGIALAVPQGSPVEADIASGYRTYVAALGPWGLWAADPLYSVHWCPRSVDALTFAPYQAGGHWAPNERGTPYWVSDDAGSWADITMHHGWWIQVDQSSRSAKWCWVPGTEETDARVVWREADGFVAWAPEPPMYVDDDRETDDVDLSWAYELLGTLFDHDVSPALLQGDAAAAAHSATWAERHHVGTGASGTTPVASHHAGPPTASEVSQARHALSSYVIAHPVVATGDAKRSEPASGSRASSTSASVASVGSSGADEAHAASESVSSTGKTSSASPSSHTLSRDGTEDPLPPSMAIYEQMVHDPFGGPGGVAPSPYLPFFGNAARAGTPTVGGTSVVPSQYATSSAPSSTTHTRTSSSHSSSGSSGGHSSSHSSHK